MERKNIVWNMIGSFCYAFASMVLSFLVMRIVGDEAGGIFSFGFSTLGQQLFILAYFGVRPYQVTDVGGRFSFGDYLRQRIITCVLAVAGGGIYLMLWGYSREKILILFLLILYKVIDGFGDVYESEFQRNGKLYLTGQANTFRTVLSVGCFLAALLVTRHLLFACTVAVTAQIAGVLLFDVRVLSHMDGIRYQSDSANIRPLFGSVWLLFLSTFLDFYIFSASKYAIDAYAGNAASGYYNILFMPTSFINLAAGFVIRPFLTVMSEAWQTGKRDSFYRYFGRIATVIISLSLLSVGAVFVLGEWVLGLAEVLLGSAYQGALTQHSAAFMAIIAGGGCYALLNLFYYVLVIMRRQKVIFASYLLMVLPAAFLAAQMVQWTLGLQGIIGASLAYFATMFLMMCVFAAGVFWRRSGENAYQSEENV